MRISSSSLAAFVAILFATNETSAYRNKLRGQNIYDPNLPKLTLLYEWKSLSFSFANGAKINATKGLLPIDTDVYVTADGRKMVFVTVPRFQDDVPVTMGVVAPDNSIRPYPTAKMQNPGGNCNGFTSIFRVAIDSCDRIWVLDTGMLLSNQVCPPKLVQISLKTNQVLKTYNFPADQYIANTSLFVTPMVDIREKRCNEAFVYIADVAGFGLVVYDDKTTSSWRITNNLFYPYPLAGRFNIRGESFDLMDGILGLALGPIQNQDRMLYFHSLASRTESYVPTSVIRNGETFKNSSAASPLSFEYFPNERSGQSVTEATSSSGVLFYGLTSKSAVGCWNTNNFPVFNRRTRDIAVKMNGSLDFISGIKIVPESVGNKEQLVILSSPFQKFMTGTLNPNVPNFRIFVADVEDLTRGTICDRSYPANPKSFSKFPRLCINNI